MSQRVVNDVDVTFDCYALAEPVHSLTWYFVSANGRADYGRLLVRAVQFEDRGTYMCLAENRHGTDTEFATLSVQGE